MQNFTRNIFPGDPNKDQTELFDHEWLLTNGLGGYASTSITGLITRKYHGLLLAALPSPLGRTVMLNQLIEEVVLADGTTYQLTIEENKKGELNLQCIDHLKEFRLEFGLPVWVFEVNQVLIEKRILLTHLKNTVHISYKLLTPSKNIRLKLHPLIHFRSHEAAVDKLDDYLYSINYNMHGHEISKEGFPPLRLKVEGDFLPLNSKNRLQKDQFYRLEYERGYESKGRLWSPGYFEVNLASEIPNTLTASTELWDTLFNLSFTETFNAEIERKKQLLSQASASTKDLFTKELTLAADQFIIEPTNRKEDKERANASGNEVRTIIAGYHWFTDWGRDTMIALEGLTLCTGRLQEAKWILRTFHHYIRDGLIPNMFPEGKNSGLYHTADATLWFFHALDRYLKASGDRETLKVILPALREVIQQHQIGTKFGIGVDPKDGLLKQGVEGYQLTWMDAKVDSWVVTPRRGKAVEINGLWYNALRLTEEWVKAEFDEETAQPYKLAADLVYRSFNQRFWYSEGRYLYDIVDGEQGDDTACRPNQLLSFSLKHPVLAQKRWPVVIEVVEEQLLTPFGLRSLAPNHVNYHSKYEGNLRSRDGAYHQGTVWSWLIGPFIDAWLKVHQGKNVKARTFLKEFNTHLENFGVGSISEIFDATPPFKPRGCIAQAWSIAEVLRCWLKTEPDNFSILE